MLQKNEFRLGIREDFVGNESESLDPPLAYPPSVDAFSSKTAVMYSVFILYLPSAFLCTIKMIIKMIFMVFVPFLYP